MKTPSTDILMHDDFSSSIQSDTPTSKPSITKKKKKRLNTVKYKSGRWDANEHRLFLELFMKYKKNWKKVKKSLK